jgi:bifunctional non-homologous end joining protein LigD
MKPKMVSKLPDDRTKWLLEPKLDGYRVIATKAAGHANLYSMDAKLYNQEFPDIYSALEKLLHKNVVLDGEIVAVESSGRPNFNALQNRRSGKLPIYYVAFDCLHYKGRDLLDKPIEERKKTLAEIAKGFISPMQPIFDFLPDVDLQTAITVVKETNIEGLVAKRLGSKYYPGQESDLWLKQRFNQEGRESNKFCTVMRCPISCLAMSRIVSYESSDKIRWSITVHRRFEIGIGFSPLSQQ